MHAQDDGGEEPEINTRIKKGIRMYMQNRLALTDKEAGDIEPVIGRYLEDMRKAHRDNTDPLVRQQKKAEIRIKYRDELKPIIGEQKATRFFGEIDRFTKKIREELQQRRQQRRAGARVRKIN